MTCNEDTCAAVLCLASVIYLILSLDLDSRAIVEHRTTPPWVFDFDCGYDHVSSLRRTEIRYIHEHPGCCLLLLNARKSDMTGIYIFGLKNKRESIVDESILFLLYLVNE